MREWKESQAHHLDYSAHCLRLKFLTGNQMQFYVPKSDEDIYELLYKEIEICEKVTQQINIEKSDTLSDNYGFCLCLLEEEGIRRLYVSSVKETGLAFKKGLKAGDEIVDINKKAAQDLNSVTLRDILVQHSLCLTVRTYPESEQKLTQLPPRRMDSSFDLAESPSRSVNSQGTPVQ
uniref:T-lymphoma invasion and metastasis-inducing protein 1 n=1 Tax=Sphaerodactylus townsendi TaxID=933632 RepID=A0ACB8FIC4_9SAUR